MKHIIELDEKDIAEAIKNYVQATHNHRVKDINLDPYTEFGDRPGEGNTNRVRAFVTVETKC